MVGTLPRFIIINITAAEAVDRELIYIGRARARGRVHGHAGGLVIIPYLSSLKNLTPLIPNTPLADTRVVQSFLVWHRTREYDVKTQSPVFRSGGHQQGIFALKSRL